MKRSIAFVASLATGIVVGFAAEHVLQAQPVKRTSLLRTEIEGIQGKIADVFLIELAPAAATGKHSHPGSEIAYILEGAAAVDAEGKKTITQKRGSVAYLPPNQVHEVKNPSKTETTKAIVFALYDKDKPAIVPVK